MRDKKDIAYCKPCIYSELLIPNRTDEICCMYLCYTGKMRPCHSGYGCTAKKKGKKLERYVDGTSRRYNPWLPFGSKNKP